MSLCCAAKALSYFRFSDESGQHFFMVVFGHHIHYGSLISVVDSAGTASRGRTEISGNSAVLCTNLSVSYAALQWRRLRRRA